MDTWRGMEEALKLGLTKSIGVSNFNEEQLGRLLKSAKVKPVVNQVEVCKLVIKNNTKHIKKSLLNQ